jgi:poly(3-hydroxyalkanoate) depolymerase
VQALRIRALVIGDQTLRVAEGGAPDADRTLLLFNGIGASVESIADFAAQFERTRVVAFDVPGVGGSPTPLLPYRMSAVAALAAGLLDELQLATVDVFGVSWGGAAAQEFAIRHRPRCRTLTLAATSAGFVMVPGQPAVIRRLLSPRRYLDPAHLLEVGGQLYGGVLRTERELLRVHAEALRSPSRLGYLYQLLAAFGWTSWLRLHRIRTPTLVLVGADDPIVPPINGRLLALGLPDATVETVDCGHLFMLTRPRETAARVERFLAQPLRRAPTSTFRRLRAAPPAGAPGDDR